MCLKYHVRIRSLYKAGQPLLFCGLKKVEKYDEIYMEGYLVNIESFENGRCTMTWNSSLSRNDKGNGACEIMFVTKIITKYGEFVSAKNQNK